MVNHPNRSKSHPYIRAWCSMMGSADYYVQDQLARARSERAPHTAIYRSEHGWETYETITREDTRLLIDRLVERYL